jgi:hypothetical protein
MTDAAAARANRNPVVDQTGGGNPVRTSSVDVEEVIETFCVTALALTTLS